MSDTSREFLWPVVPICERQRRDIRPEDLLASGLYRLCDSSRAGGGYDPLPRLVKKRLGMGINPMQFVVQLQRCPLACHYCYVTKDGVNGSAIGVSSSELIHAFGDLGGVDTFHLMGGSPALYLDHWPELVSLLDVERKVFHSDLLLIEGLYNSTLFKRIFAPNSLYAINIKGTSDEELCANTQRVWDRHLVERFWANLTNIIYLGQAEHCYFTFTNCDPEGVLDFLSSVKKKYPSFLVQPLLDDYVEIPLKSYLALQDGY